MDGFLIRKATLDDVPFLVETIIEAEKSSTDILSYSTIFGLSEFDTRKYLVDIFNEEVDGCELSVSSFLIAEKNGVIAGSVAAWIEGFHGLPSSVLKGNLLNYILPKSSMVMAAELNLLLKDLHIEVKNRTLQLGLVYVSKPFRGMNLVSQLIDEQIRDLIQIDSTITDIYVQVFGNNLPAIRAYEKSNFKTVLIKKSLNADITDYLPANTKLSMKKEIFTN